jgi:AAA15 family ATPase/GTPase
MHPTTIKKLLEEIIKLVKDKQIQVFISTQSLEVLSNIAKLLDDKVIEEKDVRTYTLNLVNGELTARKFWGTALSDWLHSGFDPRLLDVSEDDVPFAWHLKKEKTEEELLW